MGLLKLLTFPVSVPVSGGRWVLQTLLDAAERRYYDPATIQEQLAQIERQHRAGEIDDAAFDALEEDLLQRFVDAQAYHRRRETHERSPT
jgi:hypothetical protein